MSPTTSNSNAAIDTTASDGHRSGHRRRWIIVAVGVVVAVVAATILAVVLPGDDGGAEGWQTAEVRGQGDTEPALAPDGAQLMRRDDGLHVVVEVPTPQPGSYEYPTNEMIPPTVEYHPPVSPGAADAPEVFTLWLFAFNDGSECTDGQCGPDDTDAGSAARGGVYQAGGRIADADTLRFESNIRLGQQPDKGSPLDNPHSAEVHVAIAPHGRALSDTDGWIQLNTAIGNPTLWWGARFPAP